jgi:hypothetical protein
MGEQLAAHQHDEVPAASARKVGRPRKWTTEAERKQAYRRRLAADFDDPLSLRRELRTERRRIAGLKQENDRLRARLVAAERRTEVAEEAARFARDRVDWLKGDADRDRRQLVESRAKLAALEAEIDRLRRSGSHWPPALGRPPTQRSPLADEPVPVPVRAKVGPRCFASGCGLPAICRVRGSRGVERDACDVHTRLGRPPERWWVVRRY